jgi:ABC-type antimicrobial peptide transport system permease subunit
LATVSPFLDEQLTGRQPEAELANRVSRWVWLAGVSAAVGLVAVLWYGRREEFALYRLLGLRRGALGVLLATEAALTVAVPALIGGSVALVVCLSSLETASRSDGGVPALAPLVGADVASFVLGMELIPVIGLGVVSWRSTFDALKGF